MMSASRRNTRGRDSLSDDISKSLQDVNGSLPIRTTTKPTPKRPGPSTLQLNHKTPTAFISPSSSSSASSSESSTRIFDEQSPLLRVESPTTPPESSLMLGSNIIQKSTHIASECSPQPKASRHLKKLQACGDGPPMNRKNAPRRSGIHTAPPPLYASSLSHAIATHSRSVSNPEKRVCSSVNQQVDDSGKSDASAKSALNFQGRPRSIIIPDSDEESDEHISDASEEMTANLPEIVLGSEEDEGQHEENTESDDGDVAMPDAPNIPGVPEDVPGVDSYKTDPFKFTRYRVEEKNKLAINKSILDVIKNTKQSKKQTSKSEAGKLGWVYIFESANKAPGHLKIGKSIDMEMRKKDLESCFGSLKRVEDIDMNAFYFYDLVESLVKKEFHNQRRKLVCHCGTDHEEWFEVNKGDALKSIQRWRTWVKTQNPYDKGGKLTPFWAWRVKNGPKIVADMDWDEWLQPTWLECADYCLEEHGKGHYVDLKAHLGRKDKHFWLVGMILLLCMQALYGRACSALILIALICL